ncbi:MAG: hypothetical protein A2041_09615 [Bacteroidetes bacterium GWA2_31_9b]|nr:MAG: hypothetical protein A2041_09615 [Bacteroidetes bacterium GWA2_31_9b]
MKKVVIVGAGQFGSRHLQGLALVKELIEIYVVDVNNDSLQTSKSRFLDVASKHDFRGRINYINNIKFLPNEFDVAIVACDSLHRKEVIIQLLNQSMFRFLILEKFLFPSICDYSEVESLLEKRTIKTWVNCTRRMFPTYINIKKIVQGQTEIKINVSGSNLNLGSNAVHFVDLFSFLSGEIIPSKVSSMFVPRLFQSKRDGYIDFFGTLNISFSNTKQLTITSFEQGSAPILIEINSPEFRFMIQETGNSFLQKANSEKAWVWESEEFTIPFQSNLTNVLVEELFSTGSCRLTEFKNSVQHHIPLLKEFTNHYSLVTNKDQHLCPIT